MGTFKTIADAITGQDYASLFQPVFEKRIEQIECYNPARREYEEAKTRWQRLTREQRWDCYVPQPPTTNCYAIYVRCEGDTQLLQMFSFYYDMLPSCCGAILAHTLQPSMSVGYRPLVKGMKEYELAHELLVSAWEKAADESGHTKLYYTSVPNQRYIIVAFEKRGFSPVDKFVSQRTNNEISMWSKYVATPKEEVKQQAPVSYQVGLGCSRV